MEASNKYLSLSPSTCGFFCHLLPSSDSYIRNGHFPTKCRRWNGQTSWKTWYPFPGDKNQSAFICYENFENYHREHNTSINDYLIQFNRHVAKLREFQITLPELVLAYRALKSANFSPENERLIRATINNLTLYDMAQQLKKITCGNLTPINTSQQQSISVKKEMDIAFSWDDTHSKDDQILYGRHAYNKLPLPFHLSSSSTNNRRGPRKFNGRYSNRQSPNCYIRGCKFHYSNKCPYSKN